MADAWSEPVDRATGLKVTAAIWNLDQSNLRHLKSAVVGKDASFTAAHTEAVVYVVDTSGGVVDVTLPDPTTYAFVRMVIKRNGASNVTLSGQNIDGASAPTLATDKDSIEFFSDGTALWRSDTPV